MAAKLEVLERLPIRVLGAVLNDVPPGAAYRYYSYYLPGYEAVAEDTGRNNRQPLVISGACPVAPAPNRRLRPPRSSFPARSAAEALTTSPPGSLAALHTSHT